jgi:hypothetical protein
MPSTSLPHVSVNRARETEAPAPLPPKTAKLAASAPGGGGWSRSAEAVARLGDLLERLSIPPKPEGGKAAVKSLDTNPHVDDGFLPSPARSYASPQRPDDSQSPPCSPLAAGVLSAESSPRYSSRQAHPPLDADLLSPAARVRAREVSVPRRNQDRILIRPPQAEAYPYASPERAAAAAFNRLAPWEKPTMWRAMRSEQVPVIESSTASAGALTREFSVLRAVSRERRDVEELADRTSHSSVPGAFFTRMLLRGAPPTRVDHTGEHSPVASRRRNVEAW